MLSKLRDGDVRAMRTASAEGTDGMMSDMTEPPEETPPLQTPTASLPTPEETATSINPSPHWKELFGS